MSKKIMFCFVLLLLVGISLAHANSVTEGIVYITGQDIDARVKQDHRPVLYRHTLYRR